MNPQPRHTEGSGDRLGVTAAGPQTLGGGIPSRSEPARRGSTRSLNAADIGSNLRPRRVSRRAFHTLTTENTTMSTQLPSRARRTLFAVILPVLALLTTAVLPAMAQTPEGTTITNTATASFTDANGNTYSDVSDNVSITVGFQGGLDVVAPSDVAPAAGTDNLTLDFLVINAGNGTDTLSVTTIDLTHSAGGGAVENVRYVVNTVEYADTASLNAALALIGTAAGDTLTITVKYDVINGSGGENTDITLGVTSARTNGNSDSDVVNVAPPLGGTMTVTLPADQSRLPSNGTTYTMTFPVTSTLSGTDSVAIKAAASNANVTITQVQGVAGDSVALSFVYNETKNIVVTFTVADVAAGSTAGITLTATSFSIGTATDSETATVTVIRPALTITKGAFTDAAATTAVSGNVLPGQTIYFKVTVTNSGTAAASNVSVEDVLPAEVTYVNVVDAGSGPTAFDSLTFVGGKVTGTESNLPVGESRAFIVEVTIN